jgi:hypothetical protein
MADVRVIGVDIAKSVFQLHGITMPDRLFQKRLTRGFGSAAEQAQPISVGQCRERSIGSNYAPRNSPQT